MRRYVQMIVALGLAAFLLAYVVDIRRIGAILGDSLPLWVLAAIGVFTIDRALMSCKWILLLRIRGHNPPFLQAMMIYCSAMVWGMVLPTTVGADAVRAAMLRRQGVPSVDSVASIVVERALGFIVALCFGIASLFLLRDRLPASWNGDALTWIAATTLAGGVGLLGLSLSSRAFDVVTRPLPRRLRNTRIVARIFELHEAYRSIAAHRRTILAFVALTAVEQLVIAFSAWVLARAVGADAAAYLMMAATTLAILVSRIPVSFDGIGVYEGIFIAVTTLFGLPPEVAVASGLLGRILQLVAWLPWWIAYVLSAGSVRPPTRATVEAMPVARSKV